VRDPRREGVVEGAWAEDGQEKLSLLYDCAGPGPRAAPDQGAGGRAAESTAPGRRRQGC